MLEPEISSQATDGGGYVQDTRHGLPSVLSQLVINYREKEVVIGAGES